MKSRKTFNWVISIFLIISLAISVYSIYSVEQVKDKTEQQPVESSKLNEETHVDHEIKIYVPSTKNVDEHIDNKPYVDKTLEKFTNIFGGSTAIDGTGTWQTEDNKLVKEDTTIVYSNTEELSEQKVNKVVDYAESLKKSMEQEAVTLEVDDRMYFIE